MNLVAMDESRQMMKPEDFEQSDEYKCVASGQFTERAGKNAPPVAFILPSTKESVAAASRLRDDDKACLVGGVGFPGLMTPAEMLTRLSKTPGQQLQVIVFSDQILGSADASILVRTDGSDNFYSPFEAILNIKYGYRLAIWTMSEYVIVEPHAPDLVCVFEKLVLHFRSCDDCGATWDMRQMQIMRSLNVRKYNALKKLRLFKSAVVNAYRDDPDDAAAIDLLHKVGALEQRVSAGGVI